LPKATVVSQYLTAAISSALPEAQSKNVCHYLLYLWPVTLAAGLLYLALRGKQRDPLLHIGLSAGFGLTFGAAACIGLYILYGGWGPPNPAFFGGAGLAVGICIGLATFKWGHPQVHP